MGAPVEAPTASFLDVERLATNLVPELHGTTHTICSGRLAGSPDESNNGTQKPRVAIFMYRRALNTSWWKMWIATIIFLQMKTNGKWRMKTTTMAKQEYRPHLLAQFLTVNLHVAECPQMWILLIHLQSPFPKCPWCPRRSLLHLLLHPDHHLFQLPPMLSSRILFPDDHNQSGDKWQLGDCTASKNTLINYQFSLVTGCTPTKSGCDPDLFFRCTQYFTFWMLWLMSYYLVNLHIYSWKS